MGFSSSSAGPDVVAVGGCNMDMTCSVREFPKIDEEVAVNAMQTQPGGHAGNFAVASSRLGLKVGILASVGNDLHGKQIIQDLIREKIDTSNTQRSRRRSGTVFIPVDDRGQRSLYIFRGANDDLSMRTADLAYLASAKLIHVTDPPLRFLTALKKLGKRKPTISFDPAGLAMKHGPALFREFYSADILYLNRAEAQRILHARPTSKRIQEILIGQGLRLVILMRGEKGCTVHARGEIIDAPAFHVRVMDTTGCGDAYAAGFNYGFLKGWPTEKTATFANACAALKATKPGARLGLPQYDDVMDFLKVTSKSW